MEYPGSNTSEDEGGLLASRDAQPVAVINRHGRSLFLLLGDHAGNLVPHGLAALGLDDADLNRHIALDLGVSALGARLAGILDAPFVEQRYSRLVIDCNRALGSDGSIAVLSDGTIVPGNAGLTSVQRDRRAQEVFAPYHQAIAELLADRDRRGLSVVVVSLHSFTPAMAGAARPWQLSVLYGGGDERFAQAFLTALQDRNDLVIGDNEPYRMDETDFTVPEHAFAAARLYVEVEVRQDQLGSVAGLSAMAAVLQHALLSTADAMNLPHAVT